MKKIKLFYCAVCLLVLIYPAVSLSQVTYVIDLSAPYSYVSGTNPIPNTSWLSDYEYLSPTNDGYFDLSLGNFAFQFYGVPVTTLRISTNGYITVGTMAVPPQEAQEFINYPIPDPTPPNALVAPFWDDFDLTDGGQVRWGIFGISPSRQLVIEWYQVPPYGFPTKTYSFEAILYESTNEIKFQYLNVASGTAQDYGALSTVGIENFYGTSGSQFSWNTPSLNNGLAIKFIPKLTTIFIDDFTTDKGWTVYEPGIGWERGPAVAGGGENGYPDPGAGHSPDNYILGFAIGADYPPNLLVEKSIISPPIDCTGQDRVFLKFWRYLNVESNSYDHAKIHVSNDGVIWTQLWENPVFNITDNQWTQVVFDISSIAANQGTVYIKFIMGPTNAAGSYSGWNIDDLEVISDYAGPLALYIPSGNSPNPNIDELMIENGLGIKHDTAIPNDLSDYNILIVSKDGACNLTTANYISIFLQFGGGAIIMGGTPNLLAGNTGDLSSIRDWFGAGTYGNDCGYANPVVANPLGTPLSVNDKLDNASTNPCGSASVDNLNPESIKISAWSVGGTTHSFIHSFGLGNVFYYAGNPGYSEGSDPVLIENGLILFEAGLQWALRSLPLPDLIETALSDPPASSMAGSSFSVTDTVTNQGSASAGASITSYYLSLGTAKGSGDILLTGSRSVPSLGVNGTNSGTLVVDIPSSTASGSYYLLACADDTNVVQESDENNNCFASVGKVSVSVSPAQVPVVTSFKINAGEASTANGMVTLNNVATSLPTHYMASEASDFAGATWQTYSTAPMLTLSSGSGTKTVYFKVKNAFGESGVVNDTINALAPAVTSFKIDAGAASTANGMVTLNNVATNLPTQYMASEESGFVGAIWQTYSTAPKFTLSGGNGTKTVYFKVRNVFAESAFVSDDITVEAVSAATLVSPSGTISDTTPTYTWNAVSNATWYQLYVNDSTGNRLQQWYAAEDADCASGMGTCSVTPVTVLTPGACQWKVLTWNSELGGGTWSSPMLFTVVLGPPTLVSPSGTITDTNPTYTWNALSEATWYQLYVNDSTGNRIQQWYTADACGCASGTGTCSVTPTTEVIGSCQWYIRTYNSAGFGPWSLPGMSFATPIPIAPLAATLVSPSGTISDTTPTYTWNAVSNATWYQLYVNDSTGKKIQQWYAADACGCASGTGTCSVTPTTEVIGSCQWYIQTYNSADFGPWSIPGMSFTTQIPTIPPVAATQISPSGETATTTPTYSWNAVSTASWYWLYVNDSTGNKISQWYAAADAGCPDGTDTDVCSVTPSVALAPGASQWWIRTYNNAGYGPWSLPGKDFIILTQSVYDVFSGASINKDKWGQGELVREIRGGELISKATAYGSKVINNLDFKNPASITSIEADVMIDQIEGDYDPADTAKYSLPNARLTGFFYNDGTASGPGSRKGEVQGIIRLILYRGELKAQWDVCKSLNDEATSWNTLGSGIFPDTISLNIPYKLFIQFEPSLKRFTFKLGTLTSTWTSIDTINPSNAPWKAIGTEVSFFPTTPSPFYGKVSATFDHVIAKDGSGSVLVSDDFSSSSLDSSKWGTYELVREISAEKLRSKVRSSSATTSSVYNDLDFLYPSSIDFIQTKVTPVTYQNSLGANAVARLAGYYYNDGTGSGVPEDHMGDVGAEVWLGGTGANPVASWVVFRSTDSAGEVPETMASGTFTTPISLGNTYTLALGWDGSRFTFKMNDEEVTYTPASTIKPPNCPWKAIETRIWEPAGKEATIEALFDDVMVYCGPPSAATLVSPSGTINDTTPTYRWNAVSDATWYQLYVNDSTGNKIQKWYTASEVGCISGTGTCSVTPTMEVRGSSQWWVRTYNSAGLGAWSSGMSFTAPGPAAPSAATQVSPTGTINDTTPAYRWNPVSNATWYQLWVGDSSGTKINQWYAAADAGCADGVGTCSVTPSIMVLGPCNWYIQTYNSGGLGPWSAGISFTVSP